MSVINRTYRRFTDLLDTFPDYTNLAGKWLRVKIDGTGLETADISNSTIGAEPSLGNPDTDGKILESTKAGVRTWVTKPTGITDHTLLSNIGTNTHAQIDTALTNAMYQVATPSIETGTASPTPVVGKLWIDKNTSLGISHSPVTVLDTPSIDLTLLGQSIQADVKFGSTVGTVCQGNDSRVSDAYNHSVIVSGNPHRVTAYEIGADKYDMAYSKSGPITILDGTLGRIVKRAGRIESGSIRFGSAGTGTGQCVLNIMNGLVVVATVTVNPNVVAANLTIVNNSVAFNDVLCVNCTSTTSIPPKNLSITLLVTAT